MGGMLMELFSFNKIVPTELKAKKYFKSIRDLVGVTCKKCGCKDHYWKADKWQYQCKECGFRTTLKSGTVMEHSKLPYRFWAVAMYMVTNTAHSVSCLDIYTKLHSKNYQAIWELFHKLRSLMGKRDAEYTLCKEVEVDEAFYATMLTEKPEKLKRGAGSEQMTKVLVMAESKSVEFPQNPDKPKEVGHIKMFVIPNLKKETIDEKACKSIDSDAVIVSDATKSHSDFKNLFAKHISQVVEPKDLHKILPWVHICIGNSKNMFKDFFHGVKEQFLQNYLNEFCYKFNRRYYDRDKLYNRLAMACMLQKSDFTHQYYGKAKKVLDMDEVKKEVTFEPMMVS